MNKIARNATVAVMSMGLIASAAAVPAMAEARPVYGCKAMTQEKAKTGTIIGALLGGALGGSVADTHNKGLGVAAGAVVGGLVGNSVAKDKARDDCYQARMQPVRYKAYDSHNYNRYSYDRHSYSNNDRRDSRDRYDRNDGRYGARW
ncbi:MAG: glycine zipper 2TM domain-containing protein [Asticcacaulis sp.]|uniref:glycine zipper 2TM domain-containing protein n=1 Tax=Asticcacaulis sp. TaxID=1872648 RepID=UPI003F7CBB6B